MPLVSVARRAHEVLILLGDDYIYSRCSSCLKIRILHGLHAYLESPYSCLADERAPHGRLEVQQSVVHIAVWPPRQIGRRR